MCVLGPFCLRRIYICDAGRWVIFEIQYNILFSLDVLSRPRFYEKLCKRSRCSYSTSLVGYNSARSSANSRHLISESSRVMPDVPGCSHVFANLVMYMFKRVGLKMHHCQTPRLWGMKSLCFLPILTAHLLLVCIEFMMSYVSPPTPLSNYLYSKPSCQIESNAFLTLTKQENNLPLSIRVLKVKIWSVVQ